jgi:hypothetical protein
MGGSFVVALLAACAALGMGVAPLRAQSRVVPVVPPLLALALNELSFGTVFPGVPVSVSAADARHAGLFQVQGPPGASVRVELVLPSALAADDGARLPLLFGPRDGFADFNGALGPLGVSFDPHAPVIGSLGDAGRLFLRIGGTALPARVQSGGTYRATIYLTVFDLGT